MLGCLFPGLGASVDFAEAGYEYRKGNRFGCMMSLGFGVLDIVTAGISSFAKNAAKEGGKTAAKEVVKESAKSAEKAVTKEVGKKFAKDLASGTIKKGMPKAAIIDATKQIAKKAGNEATKKVGRTFGKDLAKGIVKDTVEEVWREGSKMTARSLFIETAKGGFCSGGQNILNEAAGGFYEEALRGITEMIFFKTIPQGTKHVFDKASKEAIENVARDQFLKSRFFINVGQCGVKYGVNVTRSRHDQS